MKSSRWLYTVLVSLFIHLIVGQTTPPPGNNCLFKPPLIDPPIKYDLSNLTRATPFPDWKISYLGWSFTINFCANTVSTPPQPCIPSTPGWVTSGISLCNDFGTLSQVSWAMLDYSEPVAGVVLTYGSKLCETSTRSLKITVKCDPDEVPGYLFEAGIIDLCSFTLEFISASGCPIEEEQSGGDDDSGPLAISIGWLLIILLFVVILLYIVFGSLYKWKWKKEPFGINIIPNIEFWKELPWLVKDGILFTGRGIMKLYRRVRGYESI